MLGHGGTGTLASQAITNMFVMLVSVDEVYVIGTPYRFSQLPPNGCGVECYVVFLHCLRVLLAARVNSLRDAQVETTKAERHENWTELDRHGADGRFAWVARQTRFWPCR